MQIDLGKSVRSLRNRSQQYLQRFIHLAINKPWLIVLLAVASAAAALWYTGMALEFATSRNALVSSHARYIQLEDEVQKDFGETDYIVVVVEPPSLERGKQFVQALAARLRADPQHFDQVIEKFDVSSLEGKKLLLLSPDDLHALRQRLQDAQDFIADLSATPGLRQLLASINREISKAMVSHLTGGFLGLSKPAEPPAESPEPKPTDVTPESAEKSLDISFLGALFTELDRAMAAPASYLFHSPWASFFLKDGEVFSEEGYLTSKNDRFLFVLVDDRTTHGGFIKHAAALRVLRAHIQALRRDFPKVQAGVTGGTALNNDEMVAAQRDTVVATVIALVGVAVLFIVTFRQMWRPLLAVAVLIVAVCWTLGFTTLTVGHLNILSVSFMPILIGLGIDFGIHLLARYGEERSHNQHFDSALQAAYRHTGAGIAAAALTTALAFYAVMLADFRGLVELGFIAGSGILLCLLASFTVLPALLALSERHRHIHPGIWKAQARDPLHILRRFPRTLLITIGLLTLVGILGLPTPRFDYNLLNLQAKGTESVVWEYRLLEDSGRSSWYAINVADSLPELYRKKAQFAALPMVDRVESLASVLPANQEVRLPLVKELAPYVEGISGTWDRPEAIGLDDISTLLQKIRFKLQREPTDWDPQKRPSEAELTAARKALIVFQERLQAASPDLAQKTLEAFQRSLMADFAAKLALLQRNLHPTPITLADVPAHLRQRFVSQSGHYLLQIFARGNIWEREPMKAFVTQLQTVDANVTGPPVVAFYSIRQMQQGYADGGLYAFIVIVGVVLFLFRSVKVTLLVLLPMVLGMFWTMAGMALLGQQLNMANLIMIPLFLGIAVDDGIHIMHRMQEDPQAATAPLARSTGKAVVLTSLTTMVGFGSLMVARHMGIFSLGLLATLAIGLALIATLVVLPVVLCLLYTIPPSSSGQATPIWLKQPLPRQKR